MATVLIIGLVVAVVSLGLLAANQDKTIKKYEQELIKKARKSSNGTKQSK